MITLNKYKVKQNEPLLLISQLCEISIKTALKLSTHTPVWGVTLYIVL